MTANEPPYSEETLRAVADLLSAADRGSVGLVLEQDDEGWTISILYQDFTQLREEMEGGPWGIVGDRIAMTYSLEHAAKGALRAVANLGAANNASVAEPAKSAD